MEEKVEIKNSKLKERIIYYDILNILACVCVVFLHMNGIVHGYSDSRAWKTALIFEVVCYWAVPIFVMLSGATLLKYRNRYNTKEFFKKRVIKVCIPWLFWSFIIFILNNKSIDIIEFIKAFAYCQIEPIYWFFSLILYLYCLIPIFSIFTEKEEHRKILEIIVLVLFVFLGIIEPICTIFNINIPTIFNYFFYNSGYIMFLLLGYLISNKNISKKKRYILYGLGIISLFIRYGYTYYMSTKEGVLNRDLFNYCSAISVLVAVSVFIFVKNVRWEYWLNKISITPSMISKMSSCSFGVYLIHIIIKNNITEILKLNTFSIWYRTIGAILLYVICVIIVLLMKKNRILNKIVP